MKQNENIKKIMSQNLITIRSDAKISDIYEIFQNKNKRHIPVVDGSKLKGMISYTDFAKVSFASAFNLDQREEMAILDSTKTAEDIMSDFPVSLTTKDTIKDAVQIISEGIFNSLPVVDDHNNLLGIVTSTDLIQYLSEQY